MKTKSIFALVLVAVLGMWTNKLKRFALLSPDTVKMTRLDFKSAEYEMYQRSNLENDRDEARPQAKAYKLAGALSIRKDEILEMPRAKAETKAAIVAKADKEKDKKKKKKKKADAAVALRQDNVYKTAVYAEKRGKFAQEQVENYGRQPTYSTPAAPITPKEDNQDSKELAEWSAKLLARPDREAVTQFIREFQDNHVSENVYYTIIDRMFAERLPDFKSLAVLAAGSVSTLRSFDFLAKVLSEESAGSSLASQAQAEIQEYAILSSVSVLRQVLSARIDDEMKIALAVQTLDVSTSHYLKSATATPANRTQVYLSFISPLEAALQKYAQNAEITVPGQRSLLLIKSLNNTVAQVEQ